MNKKVLLLENVHPDAAEIFRKANYDVTEIKHSLSEEELISALEDVDILGIRSKTQITENIINNSDLLAIGAFCIGTNQIDLKAASQNGVAVFNAPYSNTRSVVELAIGDMICLIRKVCDTSCKMHQGTWKKSANGSNEIRGKSLGIVGYGNIGAQLSVLGEALGMRVYYYDIEEKLSIGNAIKCSSLEELFSKADILSIHVDGRKDNYNFIGEKEFDQMKDGVIFINLSRGFIVDIKALRKNLENGKIRGAAIDVYPEEPKANTESFHTELQGMENVILTPHIGGSTMEAQKNIAKYVAGKMIDFNELGNTTGSVNFPNLRLPELINAHRVVHVHKNKPGVLAEINKIMAQHDINVDGQYLKTNQDIGYVITDIYKIYDKHIITGLEEIDATIKLRLLY